LAALAEKGVLALAAGSNVMRFLPPLVIDAGDIDRVVEAVATVLTRGTEQTSEVSPLKTSEVLSPK
ncbi:MAG: hypothetical protein PVJ34_22820, partial [Anaerolineae bacterium]